MFNYKPYRYAKGENIALDEDFADSVAYEKVRLGKDHIFWKSGLRWHFIPLEGLQRIYRRVEQVHGRLCCGGQNFIIHWLVMDLSDGSELVVHIGDDVVGTAVRDQADTLLAEVKRSHPLIPCGKV
jgi:hypothetical protein